MSGTRCGRREASESAWARPGADEPVAAIDLGTNNCRLLIARPTQDGFRVIDAFSRIVRLGEGLNADGRLSEAAMRRCLDALRICAEKLRRHRVRHLRAVATEACRRAANGGAFLARVRRETGLDLEVIDQEAEARLALAGCAPLLQPEVPNALIFDIGGGSTEVIWLREVPDAPGRMGLSAWYSLPVGVVGLSETYRGRNVDAATYEAMIADVRAPLTAFVARSAVAGAADGGAMQMIGTSGTVTTLAGVYQNLPRYDRRRVDGCYLSFETIWTVSRRIAGMSEAERLRNPCIGTQRADLVVAGCAILEAICRTWPVGRLRVADRGLREGMLLQMLGRARPEDFEDLTAPPETETEPETA